MRGIGKVLGFTKPEVINLLKSLEQPTPTDTEHGAEWWNTQFGKKVKVSFLTMIHGVVEQIERAKGER